MIGWEYPPFQTGGLAVHCYELVHALAKKGVSIDFYMPRIEREPYREDTNINIIPVRHVRHGAYVSRHVYGPSFFEDMHSFNEECARMIVKEGGYDVIHNHDWITSLAAIRSKHFLGRPMILTIHSTEYDRAGMWPNQRILDIERMAMGYADRVITVSNYMKRRLSEKFGVDERKIRVIYNAIRADLFEKRWNLPRGREKIVLFLGRLTEQKGPVQFLYAAKKVLERERNVRFVIAGTGGMLPYLINLAISLGISTHTTFIGYLPEEQKRVVYAKSDVFVMPSVSEPFGITALEAMASGTPVLLSKTSGVAEITPHRLTVDFWDVNKMAEKILALLKYQTLSELLGRREYRDAKDLTWDKVADETLKVYYEVVRETRSITGG